MNELREKIEWFDFAEERRTSMIEDVSRPYCSNRLNVNMDIRLIENAQARRVKSIMQSYGILDMQEVFRILRSGSSTNERMICIVRLGRYSNVS